MFQMAGETNDLIVSEARYNRNYEAHTIKNIDFFHEYDQMSRTPSRKQPSMVSRSTQLTATADTSDKCEQGTMTTETIEHGRPIANKCTNTSNERVLVVRCTKCLKRYRNDEIAHHSNRCDESTSQLDLIGYRLTDRVLNDRPNSVISTAMTAQCNYCQRSLASTSIVKLKVFPCGHTIHTQCLKQELTAHAIEAGVPSLPL